MDYSICSLIERERTNERAVRAALPLRGQECNEEAPTLGASSFEVWISRWIVLPQPLALLVQEEVMASVDVCVSVCGAVVIGVVAAAAAEAEAATIVSIRIRYLMINHFDFAERTHNGSGRQPAGASAPLALTRRGHYKIQSLIQ